MNRRRFRGLCLTVILGGLTMTPAVGAEFDSRAHDDLNGIVFLCATEPGSPRFDSAWLEWLTANPGADVEATIREVLSRAGTVRSMALPGIAPAKPGSRPDADAVAAHMAALAKRR